MKPNVQQTFVIVDGDESNLVYEVEREELKRYYRAVRDGWEKENAVIPALSEFGKPIPGARMDEYPLEKIDHRLDREYDPQECLDAMEEEENAR